MPRTAARACLALLLVLPLPSAAADRLDPDLLAGLRARSIGPAGMSGRVTAVAGVESRPDVLYAGAASGGVWKSVSGGLTWEPIFDDQPIASVGALAVFQKNPDIVWVGSGEANVRNSTSVGNGVYRSQDGGRTWSHLGLDATERISRVVLHPEDPDVAWVAALGRQWGENPERGVFKTTDGGKSWRRVLYVDEKTGAADLDIDPGNPRKLFAAMWQFRRWPWSFKSGGPGSGLFVSHDGGETWKRRSEDDGLPKGELGRIKVAVSRSHPAIVYASVEAGQSALLRSEDGGERWAAVNTKPSIGQRPFYFADLEVDPRFPNRVYDLAYNLRVSDDSGKSFANLPLSSVIHGDYHALWIDPANSDRMVVGDDGGLAVSHDRGRTAAFVANLPLAQFYHVGADMEVPYNLYGGLQDNGSWRGPSSVWEASGIRNHQWQFVGFGDGFDTQPDPADAMTGYSMAQTGYLQRFNLRTNEFESVRPPEPDGMRLRFNWNAGLAVDPSDGTVYYGSQFLHKSTDRGKTWTIISPDLTTNRPEWQKQDESGGLTPDVSGAENYTTIIAISPSPRERGVIWVGTDDGRLQVTRDGGKSWTSVEKNVRGVPANTWIPHVRASRFDPASAFVVFDDHRRSNWATYAYRTDDYGKTWKSLAGKNVRGYALAIEQDAVDRDLLFLGTEFGLWFSRDGGASWLPFRHGLPATVSVMDLLVHPREHDLVIATHGRGLYVVDDVSPLRGISAEALAEPVHLFPMADVQQHNNGPGLAGGYSLGSVDYNGENRPYGAILTYSLHAPDLPLPDEKKERERKEKRREAARREGERPGATDPERAAGPLAEGGRQQQRAAAAARRDAERESEQAPGQEALTGESAGESPATETTGEKKEAGKPEESPKVEIRIADASGKVVRRFKAPARLGVNRAVWGLQRDSFKLTPPGVEGPPNPEDLPGPEVPAGVYKVTVKLGDKEAERTVRVVPDPRLQYSDEDRQARWQEIERAGRLQDVLVEAIDRIRTAKSDLDAVAAKARRAAAAKRESEGLPRDDEEKVPLADEAGELGKKLDALEKRLWISPDAKGIQPPVDVSTKVQLAYFFVQSGSGPASPTNREYLRQAESALGAFLVDLNRFFAEDLTAFKQKVAGSGVELLAPAAPLKLPSPG